MAIINNLATSNTFTEWLAGTQSTISKLNTITDGGGSITFIANTNINVTFDLISNGSYTVKQISDKGNSSFIQANSAYIHANAAFDAANTATGAATDTTARANANAAFAKANSSFITANAAFLKANTPSFHANSAFIQANAAFGHANASFIQANAAFIRANNSLDANNGGTVSATITISTGSVIVSSGNIAVGTSSPQDNVHVVSGNIQVSPNSFIGTTNTGTVSIGTDVASTGQGGSQIRFPRIIPPGFTGAPLDEISFWTSFLNVTHVERMRISSSGKVGIGTVNPGVALDVVGDAAFTGSLGVGTASSNVAGEIRATNNITAYYSSDLRLKKNIVPIQNALSSLNKIRGVRYEWTDDYIKKQGGEDGYFVRKDDVGVIAQEVQKVLPEIVVEREDGYLAVKYDRIVALLIEAVKELQVEVEELKKKQNG
jgi:hypothetical protein